MFSVMFPHIYAFGCGTDGTESRFQNSFGRTGKSHYGTVGCLTRIYIKQLNSFHPGNHTGYPVNDLPVPSLGKVRDTFDDLFHIVICK